MRRDVFRAQRMAVEFRGHEVAPLIAAPLGVRNVAGGLLEVRHQPAALEHFGQDVRRVLDRQMHAAQLRDRVVSVVAEHTLIQLLGLVRAHARVACRRGAANAVVELVQEQPPQRLRRPRIAREQRALDRLRQIDEREHRPIDVREVRRNGRAFRVGEAHSSSSSSSGSVQNRRYSSMNAATPTSACGRRTARRRGDPFRAESRAPAGRWR